MLIWSVNGVKLKCNKQQGGKAHHAPGPAVHHLCQSKLELPYKLFSCLWYPTIPLQLSDPLGHWQHPINALNEKEIRDRDGGTSEKE